MTIITKYRLASLAAFVCLASGTQVRASEKVFKLPFINSGVRLQQGWIYTWSNTQNHQGIDYMLPDDNGVGQPFQVVAAYKGMMTCRVSTSLGNVCEIEHFEEGISFFSRYAHLAALPQPESAGPVWMDTGDSIAMAGMSGNAYGVVHLHFELAVGFSCYSLACRVDPYDIGGQRDQYPGWENYTGMGTNHWWADDPPAMAGPGSCIVIYAQNFNDPNLFNNVSGSQVLADGAVFTTFGNLNYLGAGAGYPGGQGYSLNIYIREEGSSQEDIVLEISATVSSANSVRVSFFYYSGILISGTDIALQRGPATAQTAVSTEIINDWGYAEFVLPPTTSYTNVVWLLLGLLPDHSSGFDFRIDELVVESCP